MATLRFEKIRNGTSGSSWRRSILRNAAISAAAMTKPAIARADVQPQRSPSLSAMSSETSPPERSRALAPGTAIVTDAGALRDSNNVRRVIHVAAVHGEPGAGFRQVQNIDTCVTNVLARAEAIADEDPAVRTVLFPLLGNGSATGAGTEATARTMLLATLAYLADRPRTRLRTISFLGYTVAERSVLEQVVRTLPLAPLEE